MILVAVSLCATPSRKPVCGIGYTWGSPKGHGSGDSKSYAQRGMSIGVRCLVALPNLPQVCHNPSSASTLFHNLALRLFVHLISTIDVSLPK